MNPDARALREHLEAIYGDQGGEVVDRTLEQLMARLPASRPGPALAPRERLSEGDAILISYGDQIRRPGEAPLATLQRFLRERLAGVVSGVHLLPFYPSTSDDGFSVVDYRQVDPALGDWQDVARIGGDYKLMFDAVINHVSVSSPWFQGFLRDDPRYRNFFIAVPPKTDVSSVTRPRTTALLTPFATAAGVKHLWTTFSADQVDLNYANPEVLLEVIGALLDYVARGAEIIRLDAVTYLWKEVGSSGVHHPKTHRVLQLIRAVMNVVAPQVILLTETNVPHEENVAYFGDGFGEAQMVYNFALPPLVLHSFMTGDASKLKNWARALKTPSKETTFFNFLASHDGVGVRPVEKILGQRGIRELAARALAHGGLVSYKTNPDGSESPYELNIGFFDALSDPQAKEALDRQIARFLCANAVMLALAGVPGIYIHSLLGSRSFHEGVRQTGHKRSINREKFLLERLEPELDDPKSLRAQVLAAWTRLLAVRRRQKSFHPQAPQRVLDSPAGVFALARGETLVCLHNVSGDAQTLTLEHESYDLLRGETLGRTITLEPYGLRWLERQG